MAALFLRTLNCEKDFCGCSSSPPDDVTESDSQSLEDEGDDEDFLMSVASVMNLAYSNGIEYFINGCGMEYVSNESLYRTSKDRYYASRWNGHLPLARMNYDAPVGDRRHRHKRALHANANFPSDSLPPRIRSRATKNPLSHDPLITYSNNTSCTLQVVGFFFVE